MKYGKLSRKDVETLERLAETPEGKAALMEFVEKQKEARKAYKRYVKLINEKEKTPNEIRAAFIEKCKRYIEKHGNGVEFYEGLGKGFAAKKSSLYHASYTEGVSNDYIEKANALAWLLKDYGFVDKTENAPQPTEPVVGHKLNNIHSDDIDEITDIKGDCMLVNNVSEHWGKYTLGLGITKIIDDTNAKYKEETK